MPPARRSQAARLAGAPGGARVLRCEALRRLPRRHGVRHSLRDRPTRCDRRATQPQLAGLAGAPGAPHEEGVWMAVRDSEEAAAANTMVPGYRRLCPGICGDLMSHDS